MTCKKRRLLYHHRTQGKRAEGSHIRGMVDGFRSLGYGVDLLGPPGVDPYRMEEVTQPAAGNLWSRALAIFSELAPEPCFEAAEILYNLFTWLRLRSQLCSSPYDFVYERYSLNSFACALVCSAAGIPLVLEVNDATVIERSRPLCFSKMARRAERAVFQRAALLVTISTRFKELIVAAHGLDPAKILVLPNAIDPRTFGTGSSIRVTRADLGIPDGAVVVGCAGAFVPWHGLDFLVESLAGEVRRQGLFLLLVGDGPTRAQIEEMARRMGIERSLLFTGFVPAEQVPSYLELVDVCVIPDSNPHGSPMKLFEFMAMGKPVVAPRYPPLLEVLAEGDEGRFFDPRDRAGLVREVMELVASREKRALLGAKARAAVMRRFTWDRHCGRVLDVLERLRHEPEPNAAVAECRREVREQE